MVKKNSILTPLNCLITKELQDALRKKAYEDHRFLGEIVREALSRYFKLDHKV